MSAATKEESRRDLKARFIIWGRKNDNPSSESLAACLDHLLLYCRQLLPCRIMEELSFTRQQSANKC